MNQTRILNPHGFAAGGGASYDFIETFEGSEEDSSGVAGYDNTGWTSPVVNSAEVNPNYTTSPAPFEGTYSHLCGNSGRFASRDLDSPLSDVWIYFQAAMTLDKSGGGTIFQGVDSSGNQLISILCARTVVGSKKFLVYNGTTIAGWYSAGFVFTSPVHFWLHYVAGTESDSISQIYASLDATRPASPITAGTTTGLATADMSEIRLNSGGNSLNPIYDSLIVHSSEISSDPLA